MYEAHTDIIGVTWLLGQLLILLTAEQSILVIDPYSLALIEQVLIYIYIISQTLYAYIYIPFYSPLITLSLPWANPL